MNDMMPPGTKKMMIVSGRAFPELAEEVADSTRCFPFQDFPDALTKLNSDVRLNRDDRGNLNLIRPGRTIIS